MSQRNLAHDFFDCEQKSIFETVKKFLKVSEGDKFNSVGLSRRRNPTNRHTRGATLKASNNLPVLFLRLFRARNVIRSCPGRCTSGYLLIAALRLKSEFSNDFLGIQSEKLLD